MMKARGKDMSSVNFLFDINPLRFHDAIDCTLCDEESFIDILTDMVSNQYIDDDDNQFTYFHYEAKFNVIFMSYYVDESAVVFLDSTNDNVKNNEFDVAHSFFYYLSGGEIDSEVEMCIITPKGKMSSKIKQQVEMWEMSYLIRSFSVDEFAINILEHALAPREIKHYRADRLKQFTEEEGIEPRRLPKIETSDILGKYFAAQKNDVMSFKCMDGSGKDVIRYVEFI